MFSPKDLEHVLPPKHLYSHQGNNSYQKLVVGMIWERGCRDDSKVIQFRPKNKFFIVGVSNTCCGLHQDTSTVKNLFIFLES